MSATDALASMSRRSAVALSARAMEFEGGVAVRCDELAMVLSLNALHLDAPISADRLERLGDELLGDLDFRHAVCHHGLDPSEESALVARGWSIGRDVVLSLAPRASPRAPAGAVELDEDQMLSLMDAWTLEGDPDAPRERVEQVREFCRREGRLWSEVRVGFVATDGDALAVARLRVEGGAAWLEDVYVRPDARGLGLGRAVVEGAVARARAQGCETVVIAADEADWPRLLYGRIGFENAGLRRTAHLDLAGRA